MSLAGVEAGDACEFGEEALFFRGERVWHNNFDDGIKITGGLVGHGGEAFAAEAEARAAAGAGRDGEGDGAFEGADRDFGAEGGFPWGEEEISFEVAAIEAEDGMRGDVDREIEIAGGAAGHRLALAAQANAAAVGDAARDFDIEVVWGTPAG